MESHPKAGLLLLGLFSLCAAGCIEADVRTFIKYQPKDDSFRVLEVYDNIRATKKSDLDHIASLWSRRRSIILKPHGFMLWGHSALERKGKDRYSVIDFGSPPEKLPDIYFTSVNLDEVGVVPGRFYLNSYGNLSCYHQMTVPGKIVDALLQEVTPTFATTIAKAASEYQQESDKPGAHTITWNDVRQEALRVLTSDKPPTPEKTQAKGPTVGPFQMASVRLLLRADADKSARLFRRRDVFTVIVPLCKKDCDEAIATLNLIRKTVAERVAAGKTVAGEPIREYQAAFLACFQLRRAEGAGLALSIDASSLDKILDPEVATPKPKQGKTAEYKATLAAIQRCGIEVSKVLPINKLLNEYRAK